MVAPSSSAAAAPAAAGSSATPMEVEEPKPAEPVDMAVVDSKVAAFRKTVIEAEKVKLAAKKQWQEVKAMLASGTLLADLRNEAGLGFSTVRAGLAHVKLPPLPVNILLWTFVVGGLWLYAAVSSLPTDPLVASLHLYVDFIFFAAAGVGTLVFLFGYQAR